MLNIILPIGGSLYFPAPNDDIPKILKNIAGKPMVYWAMQHLEKIEGPKRYILIGEREPLENFNIARVLRFYTECEVDVLSLDAPTQGAPCSVLLSIDRINPDEEVLVATLDQSFDRDINGDLDKLRSKQAAAGVWCFDSVHPKWSYARLDGEEVTEVQEKKPISTNALTSLYWFSKASDMYEAIMDNLRRGDTVNGQFYIAPCLNEFILRSKPVGATLVNEGSYHNFYDMQQIIAFDGVAKSKDKLLEATRDYATAFDAKDLDRVSAMFDDHMHLMDSFSPTISGKQAVVEFVKGLFASAETLSFRPTRIGKIDGSTTSIEFSLILNGDRFEGVDIVTWRDGKIVDLKAYLHKAHG